MKLSSFIPSLILPAALACDPSHLARRAATYGENSTSELPVKITLGNDPPADPATVGYFVNHIGLQVSDLEVSQKWYSDVLGMRHIFTMEVSPEFTVVYMGHSQGGRNGTGFQTGADMAGEKNNMAGLVELQLNTDSANRNLDLLSPRNTFSHMGLIVDDVNAAQDRWESQGVRILSKVGELDTSGDTEESRILAGAWGFHDAKGMQEQIQRALPGLEAIGFRSFCIIADPDGNIFEVQSMVPVPGAV